MPSTDIDGSEIMILNQVDAKCIYALLVYTAHHVGLNLAERRLADRIARDLKLQLIVE